MDFLINQWPFLLIGLLIIILIVVSILLIMRSKKRTIDVSWVIELIGENNISNVTQVQSRVRIKVKSLEMVNLEALKLQTKGIFIKEDTLIITFLNNTEEIVKGLRQRL